MVAKEQPGPHGLSPEELAWVSEQDELWLRAQEIAARHPHLDPAGLFRTLRNLERTPEERLRLGFLAGRLRSHG